MGWEGGGEGGGCVCVSISIEAGVRAGSDDVDFCATDHGDEEGSVSHRGDVLEPCSVGELVYRRDVCGEGWGEGCEEGEEEFHFGCIVVVADI